MMREYLAASLRPEDRFDVTPVHKVVAAQGLDPKVVAWLQTHGVTVLQKNLRAAAMVAALEQKLRRKREVTELAKACVVRHFAAKAAGPKLFFPLPVPVRAPKPAPSLSSMLSLYSPPEPGQLTRAIMGSSLGRP
jgi:hypothetical protein